MQLTLHMFLIVCPLVFLGGFVDSIAGGGGLITLPAYLFAGIPTHNAIATNKLSSSCGTLVSCLRFLKNKSVIIQLILPTVIAALIGSSIGARLIVLWILTIFHYPINLLLQKSCIYIKTLAFYILVLININFA